MTDKMGNYTKYFIPLLPITDEMKYVWVQYVGKGEPYFLQWVLCIFSA